ncbi:hypothetical protein GEMRC1_005754 [Eukaryota sp. GEM-RC1]
MSKLGDSEQGDGSFAQPQSKAALMMCITDAPFIPESSLPETELVLNLPRPHNTPLTSNSSRSSQDRDHAGPFDVKSMFSSHPSPTSSFSTIESPDNEAVCLRFQQSLLVSIHLHLLRLVLKSCFELNDDEPRLPFLELKQGLLPFFHKFGYVSDRLFESTLVAVKVFSKQTRFL